jgi:carbamoyl-phosphate synthase/aspartate carbamoyltransferase
MESGRKQIAEQFRNAAQGKVLALAFLEPSTRTRCSFEAAWKLLGGETLAFESGENTSLKKGESFDDTLRCLEQYSDAVVLRSNIIGYAAKASKLLNIPVLNGGDGSCEHPTQALLDAFTIRDEIGTLNGITVSFVGDLKNSRTVHSLIKILVQYRVTINLVSSKELRLRHEYLDMLRKYDNISFEEFEDIDSVIGLTDVLYMTRIQKERFDADTQISKVPSICLTPEIMSKAKQEMRILHPLPRNNEIPTVIDSDPRAAYFRQMRNGLYVRMAILYLILNV